MNLIGYLFAKKEGNNQCDKRSNQSKNGKSTNRNGDEKQ